MGDCFGKQKALLRSRNINEERTHAMLNLNVRERRASQVCLEGSENTVKLWSVGQDRTGAERKGFRRVSSLLGESFKYGLVLK